MASKGPKNGSAKAAASKAGARPATAPKPKVVAVAAEKPAPVVEAELVAPLAIEPVPAVEATPQEVEVVAEPIAAVETAVEAPAPVETIVEAIVEEAAAVLETVTEAVAAPKAATAAIKEMNVMEKTFETNVAKAQAFFADFNDRAKAAVEKSTALVTEANEFAKGNLEAVVESGKIAAKGFESLGQDAAEYSRKSFETATAALKSMSAVKSPTELFKLQGEFFKGAFDSYVAEASKGTEAFIKLASDAAQPLSNRVAVAAEKVKLAA